MAETPNQGWVRFSRKSLKSSVWKNSKVWFVWSWCLLKANHEDHSFPFNGKDITVKKGSFISGLSSAQSQLADLGVQSIRTALAYLKSTGRISIESNNKFSMITVLNWEKYQTENKPTNKPLTNEQQATNKPLTSNKNYKNDKNVKKNTLSASPPTPFDLKTEIKKLEDSPRRDLNIIALYFQERKPNFLNYEQFKVGLRRHLLPAKFLIAFTNEQILNGVVKAKKITPDWTLETVEKSLTK